MLGFSQQVALRGDRRRGQSGRRAAPALARAARRRSTSGCSRPGGSGAASTRPRSGGWGRTSIALGHHDRQLRAPLRRGAQGAKRRAGRRARLGRHAGADHLRDLGEGPRAGHGDPRLSLLRPGPLRRPATRPAGSWPRSIPPGISWRPSRCPTASTWSAALAVPVPPGQFEYRLAIQQGEEVGRRAAARHGPRRAADRRPRSRSATWCSAAAATNLFWRRTDAGHRPLQPAADVQAQARRCSSTTRSRACSPGTPYEVRLAVRKQGGSGGLFRKIFGGGGAALSLKFDAQAAASARAGSPRAAARPSSSRGTTCWR